MLLLTGSGVFAQCPSVFYDGFESGSWTPTWTPGTGAFTRSVTTSSPAVGTYCLEQTGGFSTHYEGLEANFPSSQPTYFSWYIKSADVSQASAYLVIGDSTLGGSNNGIAFVYIYTSQIRFIGSSTVSVPAVNNTWYHIEMRNINWTAKTYDVYIDGVLISTGLGFRAPANVNMSRIEIYNYHSTTAWWDEISLGAPRPNVDSVNITDVACYGDTTGMIDLSASGGTGSLGYSWSTGATTQDVSGLTGGTYEVTITDSLGCSLVDTFAVLTPEDFTVTDSVIDPTCPGDSTGMIYLGVSGATPGYTYAWSTGDTTQSISGVGSGSYSVTITDSAGCTTVDTVTITGPAAWMLNSEITEPTCNGDMDGMIDLTTSGGTPGYSYAWSTGDSTEDVSGLGAGTYAVTVTDTLGCTTTDSITVSEPTAISGSATTTPDNGGNEGAIDLTVGGGTPGYSYSWSNGATTEDIDSLAAGDYIVTVTDSNGCQWSDTFTVDFEVSTDPGYADLPVSIYPNPFNASFSIELPTTIGTADLSLTDLAGKMVWTGKATNSKVTITPDVPAGTYFLVIKTAEAMTTKKLIKQ